MFKKRKTFFFFPASNPPPFPLPPPLFSLFNVFQEFLWYFALIPPFLFTPHCAKLAIKFSSHGNGKSRKVAFQTRFFFLLPFLIFDSKARVLVVSLCDGWSVGASVRPLTCCLMSFWFRLTLLERRVFLKCKTSFHWTLTFALCSDYPWGKNASSFRKISYCTKKKTFFHSFIFKVGRRF